MSTRQDERWQRAQEHERRFWQERGNVTAILAKRKPLYADAIAELSRMLPDDPVVVDVGSGPTCWGRFFPGRKLYTDPLMASYVTRWGDEFPQGHPIAAAGEALPVRDNCCNLVVSLNALDHFADPEGAVRECIRIAQPGGLVAISVYVHPPLRAALRKVREGLGLASAPHPFSFTRGRVLTILEDAGLDLIETRDLGVVSFRTRVRFFQRREWLFVGQVPVAQQP